MNILLVTDANVERGGICMFMLQWIESITAMNIDAHICVYFRKGILDEKLADQYRKMGVELILGDLPQKQTSWSLTNRNRVRSDIRNILRNRRYDILHVNSSALGFTALALTEGLRAKVPMRISHAHGQNTYKKLKIKCLWIVRKYNKLIATRYAGCSVEAGRFQFGRGIDKDPRWIWIANTISAEKYAFDPSAREKGRMELAVSEDMILLGATGALIRQKNHLFNLEILSSLKKNGFKAKLLILGEGIEREILEKTIEEKDIKNDVILYGVSRDIPKWLSSMDIYLMPSIYEGFGIAALEAQSSGLPCILSDQVASEVAISSDVYRLPIDQGVQSWTDCIIKMKHKSNKERERGKENVIRAGFDMQSTTEYICKLYEIRRH